MTESTGRTGRPVSYLLVRELFYLYLARSLASTALPAGLADSAAAVAVTAAVVAVHSVLPSAIPLSGSEDLSTGHDRLHVTHLTDSLIAYYLLYLAAAAAAVVSVVDVAVPVVV